VLIILSRWMVLYPTRTVRAIMDILQFISTIRTIFDVCHVCEGRTRTPHNRSRAWSVLFIHTRQIEAACQLMNAYANSGFQENQLENATVIAWQIRTR